MNSLTDQQLLRDYTGRRSEAAFAELVRRHVDFVYSAALRMVRDAPLAEDVTQGVFVALAQNARPLADHPALPGWLHCTAQNLAAKAVRSDVRRRAREQEAATMNELLSAEPEAVWEHIAPHLDAALGELVEADRYALLLRFFKNHDFRTIGVALGVSDDAAQKRVSRALERLRAEFQRWGVTATAVALSAAVSANAVQAAPVGLAVTISTTATLAGTTIATTATITAGKTIAMTILQKTLIIASLAAAVGTPLYMHHRAIQNLGAENARVREPAAAGSQTTKLPISSVKIPSNPPMVAAPQTPFAAAYSSEPRQLASNLRRLGCPEETIKDILRAEVSRKYRGQEEALRPKPADHVPWGWSPKTSEGKLIERRQKAAAIAREEAASLRNALGYEVPVKMPAYAMTTSDQVFEQLLNSLPSEKRSLLNKFRNNIGRECRICAPGHAVSGRRKMWPN